MQATLSANMEWPLISSTVYNVTLPELITLPLFSTSISLHMLAIVVASLLTCWPLLLLAFSHASRYCRQSSHLLAIVVAWFLNCWPSPLHLPDCTAGHYQQDHQAGFSTPICRPSELSLVTHLSSMQGETSPIA